MTINNRGCEGSELTAGELASANPELTPSLDLKPKRTSASGANAIGSSVTTNAVRVGGSVMAAKRPLTKTSAALKLLRSAKGVTLDALVTATGWQAHSVRGFLSGTVKKKLGLDLTVATAKDGTRRYRIVETASAE